MISVEFHAPLMRGFFLPISIMTLLSQAFDFRAAYGIKKENSSLALQASLIEEEYREFLEAYLDLTVSGPEKAEAKSKEDLLKELGDLVFVCYQFAACMGWDLDETMQRIFRSNMSKLDENGRPITNKEGKVLKGPNYAPPDLSDLIC